MNTDAAFYARHRGGSGCVFVVMVYTKGEMVGMAVVSDKEKVTAWLDAHYDDDCYTAMTVPFMVDEPDWGNLKVN